MSSTSIADALVAVIQRHDDHTAFVSEVAASLAIDPLGFEQLLSELEERGAVLVRTYSSGDPHLAEVDLRIAGLIDQPGITDADPLSDAVARVEVAWQRWVGAFLDEHRCT